MSCIRGEGRVRGLRFNSIPLIRLRHLLPESREKDVRRKLVFGEGGSDATPPGRMIDFLDRL
jgi:hypothetical protein